MSTKKEVSDEQNERHKKTLGLVLKEEGNKYCADCRQRNPTWASVNLGVFVCLTCSGIHRSLGVHISQVRSTNLDTWLPKQVEFVKNMGNIKANKYWEATLPASFRRPPGNSPNPELASFIRDKYCDKRYAAKDVETPTIDNYQSHPYVCCNVAEPTSAGTTAPVKNPLPSQTAMLAAAPAPISAANSFQAQPTPVVDLLSMDEPVTASAAAATYADPFAVFTTPAPSTGAAASDWNDFESATIPGSSAHTNVDATSFPATIMFPSVPEPAAQPADPFASLVAGVQQISVQSDPQPPGAAQLKQVSNPSKASTDDIMKLYDTPQSNVYVDPLFGPIPSNVPITGFSPVNGTMPPSNQTGSGLTSSAFGPHLGPAMAGAPYLLSQYNRGVGPAAVNPGIVPQQPMYGFLPSGAQPLQPQPYGVPPTMPSYPGAYSLGVNGRK